MIPVFREQLQGTKVHNDSGLSGIQRNKFTLLSVFREQLQGTKIHDDPGLSGMQGNNDTML
eukprot:CAMPEP_0172373452 /NCGR_PEP_ID=MMETSP1060-20121228/51691_1 /TAXON_ID=37318 /ORGANISM="Pseudo-nitzschia pungens, Strain cf. cingulata" /LENGTH=60 /DNA_ID=CAMNT_0013099795 /DNA_START=68 /DNA_END=247 /DNA_ORIENTATION=+